MRKPPVTDGFRILSTVYGWRYKMKKILCLAVFLLMAVNVSVFAETNGINAVNLPNQNQEQTQDKFQNAKYRSACFASAVINGDARLVESFINLGYDVNTKHASVPVIFLAVQQNQNEILELLLANGANPDSTYLSEPVVMFAVMKENLEALNLLLKYGAKVNSNIEGDNLLREAIRKHNAEMVQLLVNYKVDVNKEVFGKTPLNYAIQQKRADIVEILLKAGAKPDGQTEKLLKKSKAPQMRLLFEQN